MLKWALMLLGAVAVHGFAVSHSPIGLRTASFTNIVAPARNAASISCGARMSGEAWRKDRRHNNKFQFKGRPQKGARGKENAGAMSGTCTLNAEKHVRKASDTGDELAREMFNRFDTYRASAMKEASDASEAFARFDEFLNRDV